MGSKVLFSVNPASAQGHASLLAACSRQGAAKAPALDGHCSKATPVSAPKLLSPYTSSVLTLTTRLMRGDMRHASSSMCVPKVLFMVKARLLPKELSTCVCSPDRVSFLQLLCLGSAEGDQGR